MTTPHDTRHVDVVVIGGGPAGENAAATAARHGLSVVLAERELVGGECSYWGCMPSKALLRPTELLAEVQRLPSVAATVTGELDPALVLRSRDAFAGEWDDAGQVPWLVDRGVELVRGHARLSGERSVTVTHTDTSSTTFVATRAVVVATGSAAARPPIPGLESVGALDNRGITTLTSVPDSLLVIGGGVIGVEMAQAWKRLGTGSVHIVELADRLLPAEEYVAAEELAAALRDDGITLHLGVGVSSVAGTDGDIEVTLGDGAGINVGQVLVATGRRPNTRDLGLETVGLTPDSWLDTDDQLRVTDVAGDWLFAVGDVNGRSLLTHMGKYQARVAGDVIAGLPAAAWADHHAVPRVVFTDPAIAAVGVTEQAARDRGIEVTTVEYDIGATAGAALLGRGVRGICKLVIDPGRDVVVGATFVGPHAGELVHAATIAIVGEVPIERLWHAVPSFPTVSEVWLRLLEELLPRPVTAAA